MKRLSKYLFLIILLVFASTGYATEDTIGGLDSSGNARFSVDDNGNIIPGADNTNDIGSSSYRVKTIYVYDIIIYDDLSVTGDLTAGSLAVSGSTLGSIGLTSADNDAVIDLFKFLLYTSQANAKDGFGLSVPFYAENDNSSDGAIRIGDFSFISTDVSDGTEDFDYRLRTIIGGAMTEIFRFVAANSATTASRPRFTCTTLENDGVVEVGEWYVDSNGAGDGLGGSLGVYAENDCETDGKIKYFDIQVVASDVSNGTEDSDVNVRTMVGGTLTTVINVDSDVGTSIKGKLLANTVNWGTGTGADSIVVTCAPAPTAYTTGMPIYFSSASASTGACSVNVNSLGWKPLKKLHDQDIAADDIEAGGIVHAVYDGTNFQMMNPEHN